MLHEQSMHLLYNGSVAKMGSPAEACGIGKLSAFCVVSCTEAPGWLCFASACRRLMFWMAIDAGRMFLPATYLRLASSILTNFTGCCFDACIKQLIAQGCICSGSWIAGQFA